MADEEIIIAFVALILAVFLSFVVYARRYKRVGPNEAMVIFGRRRGDVGFRVITGGGVFVMPIVEQIQMISLEARKADFVAQGVITKQGVPLSIAVAAQVKISNERIKLNRAVVQLLSKTPDAVAGMAAQVLLGHLRGVCASLSVEQVATTRDALASKVREESEPDLGEMGLEIVTLTVSDVRDEMGYMDALAKRTTAEAAAKGLAAAEIARGMEGDPARARRIFTFLEAVAGLNEQEFEAFMKNVEAMAKPPK